MASDELLSPTAADPPELKIEYRGKRPKHPDTYTRSLTARARNNTAITEPKNQHDSTENVDTELPPSEASANIAHTIQQLERLLDEAMQIAEFASVPNVGSFGSSHKSESGPRRRHVSFSEDITLVRAKEDLDKAGDHAANIAKTCRGACSAEGLRLLSPEPLVEPKQYANPTSSQHLHRSSAQRRVAVSRRLRPSDVPPRTTSAIPRPERYQKKGVPDIKFEDPDLKDNFGSESENLLTEGTDLLKPRPGHERHFSNIFGISSRGASSCNLSTYPMPKCIVDLNGTRHVDLPAHPETIHVHETYYPSPVARNWPSSRKRFAALVACINTACLGLVLGIYSGEVPAIQYVIVDVDRVMIMGNAGLYCGLAISTLLF